jgi:fumarate reductase subunit D
MMRTVSQEYGREAVASGMIIHPVYHTVHRIDHDRNVRSPVLFMAAHRKIA